MEDNGRQATFSFWMRRHWFLTLLAASLLAGAIWWLLYGGQTDKKEIPPVKADTRILAEGIVFPVRYAALIMPVEGTVSEILVNEGERVEAGQTLLRLERKDYEARLASVRADLAKAAAAVEQAKVNADEAARELERQRRLIAAGAVPHQAYDQALTAMERTKALRDQAESELLTQSGRIGEAESLLGKTELKSPLGGTVAYLEVKPGEHAGVGTVLVRIADLSAWEVRTDDLTELTVARIRVGDDVRIGFDGIPGLEIPGKVSFIRPFGEKKRGDMTYTVKITPLAWDDRLRWNMTAQIAITAQP